MRIKLRCRVLQSVLAVVFVINLLCSILVIFTENDPAEKCGSATDSLGVDLSSVRPTWNPRDAPDYISAENISAPYFNSESESEQVICGDERRFLLVREQGSDAYSRTLVLEPGKKYEAYIFFKNDATRVSHETESRGTRIRLNAPKIVNNAVALGADITSENAVVPATYSSAVVEPKIGSKWPIVELKSAILRDRTDKKIADLSVDSLKSAQGVLVGCSEADGQVPAGCYGSVVVSFQTKRNTYDARISSAFNDPDGPWDNSIRIGSTRAFWARYKYQNVGEVSQSGVKVHLSTPPGFPFIQKNDGRAYMTGSSRSKRSMSYDELWRSDVDLERVEIGESVEIHIPFDVGEDWLTKMCASSSKSTWISAETTADYFWSRTNFFIYPSDDMCSGG